MKKSVLVISMGTSYQEVEERDIRPVEQAIAEALPDYELRRAYGSSRITRKRKEKEDTCMDTIQEALEALVADGCAELIVQPTYIIQGYEYEKLVKTLRKFQNKFTSIRLGQPLLHQTSDYKQLTDGLNRVFAFNEHCEGFVFMGHGTGHFAHACYLELERQLQKHGFAHVWVGTLKGCPAITDIQKELKKTGCKKVILSPLMLVAGIHAQKDMAGKQEDSWKKILENSGMEVSCVLEGLGSYPFVQQMFAEHARQAEEIQTM